MAHLSRKSAAQNKGLALIFVLGTVAIISVIAIEMSQRVQTAKMMVVQRRDSTKAMELAKAAVRWSIFRLQMDTMLDQVPVIPGTNFGGKKDDLSEIQWTFPLTYPFPIPSAPTQSEGGLPFAVPNPEDGTFTSSITDESAKINLNEVGSSTLQAGTRWSGAASVLVNLLASPRFAVFFKSTSNKNILDLPRAMDDWTDFDNQVNYVRGGDENTEYRIEGSNYKIKNGPFYTLDEIKLLAPMNDKLYAELKPFITVYPFNAKLPRISTQPINPIGKININTAPVELIAALFSQTAMPSNRARLECAQLFAKARALTSFRSIKTGGTEPSFFGYVSKTCGVSAEEGSKSFIDPEVLGILEVRSDVFRIEASGYSNDIEKRIVAVVLRSGDKPKILYWKVY